MNLIFIIHNLKIFMLSKTLIKCFPPVKISSSVNLNFFAYSCYFALYNSLRGKKSFHWTYSEFSFFIVLTSLAEVLFCDELAQITTQNNAIDIEMLSHNTWNNEVVSTAPSWKFEKTLGIYFSTPTRIPCTQSNYSQCLLLPVLLFSNCSHRSSDGSDYSPNM